MPEIPTEAILVGYIPSIPLLGGYPGGYIPLYTPPRRLPWWVYTPLYP